MAIVKPFFCYRPKAEAAREVAALPYDVYSRGEAKRAVEGKPLSFLNIDRAETQFPDEVGTYDGRVYEKARELLRARVADGTFVTDGGDFYYIYQLTMDGRSQTGLVACCAVDDYLKGVVKKHENTREEKELDRIRHVDVTGAHTGPIFLAYRGNGRLSGLLGLAVKEKPLYDFTAEDGVGHKVWRVDDAGLAAEIQSAFEDIPSLYIADGHHRAASAVKVGLKRREETPGYTGEEPFNFFLSVLFAAEELKILPYNRVVEDLNGLSAEGFLEAAGRHFKVERLGRTAFAPEKKGVIGLFLDGFWYRLEAGEECLSPDPVRGLDVSVLQDWILGPILGIGDPRTDGRIDFIGGIRGLGELERRCGEDMRAAFCLYPTSMEELLAVADAGLLMPPKSTWFEPKLRSGLFVHPLAEGEFEEG